MTGCSVEGCKNRSEDGIIFKSIPKNPYKRSIWTKHMNRTPPKNGRICADHFSEDQWEIYGKVLKKHATPSIFGFPKFSLNSNIEEKMCAALPDNLNQFKENFAHLHLQKKIQNLKKRLMILKVNNKKLSNALYLQKRQNRELKEKLENVFTEDQLQAIRTKKFRKCSNETLTKSLKLKFACGTSGYTMLRKMKLPFPAIRTLNYHLQNLQFKSGVLDDVINFMKIKIFNNDFVKDCMLVLDEMDIKPGLDYCVQTGTYVGNITFPQHKGVASKALVIMLGGISTRWKQIAAF
jgi:hypothetical protein